MLIMLEFAPPIRITHGARSTSRGRRRKPRKVVPSKRDIRRYSWRREVGRSFPIEFDGAKHRSSCLGQQAPDVVMHVAREVVARGRRKQHLGGGLRVTVVLGFAPALKILVTGLEPLGRPVAVTSAVEAVHAGDDPVDLCQIESKRKRTPVRQMMAVPQRNCRSLGFPYGVDELIPFLHLPAVGQRFGGLLFLGHASPLLAARSFIIGQLHRRDGAIAA